ncbi:MAG: GAF domain-containing sensor histidine kinase [Spirochaetes bacterium]|nr:GAF domain-containing sensor histidine kinase [Spirochaetota bacterium]
MKIIFSKANLFKLIFFIILAIPFVAGYFGEFNFYSSLYLLIAAGTGPFAYNYFRKKSDTLLMADQKKFQDTLHYAAKDILTLHDMDSLQSTIVKIIFETAKSEFVAIFIQDRKNPVFNFEAGLGDIPFTEDHTLRKNSEIINVINENERPFSPDSGNHLFSVQNKFHSVRLIIPVKFNNKLLGFILLGSKQNNSAYTRHDIRAFDIFAAQAGLAIKNCMTLSENKKFQERIFQTEKSSLLGGMAEGIAHTIKNRLQYFSVAASVLQLEAENIVSSHKDLLEKYPDIEETINNILETHEGMLRNIKRTDEIIHSVIRYARIGYDESSFSEFSLKELISIASNMVKLRHDVYDIALIIKVQESDFIFGNTSQILESLYNLLDNSYEAIEEKKRYYKNKGIDLTFDPVIIVKLRETQNSYIIEAYDNGIGIQQENKNKIFAPYFTTKSSYKTKSKPGIGMFVMGRIIEEIHNGKIWFESEYLAGTTFYLELPRKRKSLTA